MVIADFALVVVATSVALRVIVVAVAIAAELHQQISGSQ